jgi:hypothetical protein
MTDDETWSTREAARYLDISIVALLRKVELLHAEKVGRGYRWPIDRVKEYARAVAGKALTDPTRGEELEK